MQPFNFDKTSLAAVVIDIGRTKLADGSWLEDKIKGSLIHRAKQTKKPCLIWLPQAVDKLPKSMSESTYQIDSFKQKNNDYKIIEDIKKASCILGESNEDCEKHFVLITKNFHDSYADLFKLIENKDYEFKVTIIAIGKENDLLQILSEENNANFIKIQNLNDLTNKIGDIG